MPDRRAASENHSAQPRSSGDDKKLPKPRTPHQEALRGGNRERQSGSAAQHPNPRDDGLPLVQRETLGLLLKFRQPLP
jgi:hypothetical protein